MATKTPPPGSHNNASIPTCMQTRTPFTCMFARFAKTMDRVRKAVLDQCGSLGLRGLQVRTSETSRPVGWMWDRLYMYLVGLK